MEENPYIVTTWEEIAKLNPWNYKKATIMSKFAVEMKRMGIVVVRSVQYRDENGRRLRKYQASGDKYVIRQYFLSKVQEDVNKGYKCYKKLS